MQENSVLLTIKALIDKITTMDEQVRRPVIQELRIRGVKNYADSGAQGNQGYIARGII